MVDLMLFIHAGGIFWEVCDMSAAQAEPILQPLLSNLLKHTHSHTCGVALLNDLILYPFYK